MKIWTRLWRDERGEASSIAMILLYTIVALGTTVGLITLRDQIVQEFGDLAVALESLDQSYDVPSTPYFDFHDTTDLTDPEGAEPAGLSVQEPPTPEGS